MNDTIDTDRTDYAAKRRRAALVASIESVRRAVWSVQHARAGDESMRDVVLASVHDRLASIARELKALNEAAVPGF